jgi:hypothetical protein
MKYALFLFAIGIWVEFETYPTLKECEEVKEILESKVDEAICVRTEQ